MGVFTSDTEVVARGTVSDISFLSSGVDESVEVSKIFNADMGPDVGSWLSVRSSKMVTGSVPLPKTPACPRSRAARINMGI